MVTFPMMPSLFNVALKIVKPYAPQAHIGGGAVRDVLLGRPIKDIDLFVGPKDDIASIEKAIECLWPVKTRTFTEFYENPTVPMKDVMEYTNTDGRTPLNIIVLKSQDAGVHFNMSRFDFGLCRVAYDGELHRTEQFDNDVINNTFTLLQADTLQQFYRSITRYERMRAKYPDWSITLPADIAELWLTGRAVKVWLDSKATDLAKVRSTLEVPF